MKRLLIAALVLGSTLSFGSVLAGCTEENRGGSAGPHDRAYTAFGDVEIYAEQYGNSRSGPAYLCSDGQAGAEAAARGRLEIKVGGVVVCESGQRLATDPFGFGAAVDSPSTDPCGAQLSMNGLDVPFEPGDVDPSAEGVTISLRKNTPVEGTYWYGGSSYTIAFDAVGWFTRGVRAASEH